MSGLIWTPPDPERWFAPSVPAPLYPVGRRTAVERTVDAALAADVSPLVVVGGDPIEGVLADRDDVRVVPHESVAAVLERGTDAGEGMVMFNGCRLYSTAAIERRVSNDVPEPTFHQDHPDVRRPWELLAANEAALAETEPTVEGEVAASAELSGPVTVEAGAAVRAGSVVEGPTVVREGATVGPNAYVRGHTLVGPDARVGHAVEVKNSVLFADATVPHLSYVGDSVVGPDANFGAGSVVANLRHDEQPVRATDGRTRVSTGRRKFGVVVGEGARLGIGTRLDAGVAIGPGMTTTPGETVTRDRFEPDPVEVTADD